VRSLRTALLLGVLGLAGCASAPSAAPGESLVESLARADRDFEARAYEAALETYRLVAFAARDERDSAPFVEAAAQVASMFALLQRPAEAGPWLAEASARGDAAAPRAWTRLLLARGLVAWRAGRTDEARQSFTELYQYCFLHGETARAIQAAQMASLVSEGVAQVEWAKRGIQAAAAARQPAWEAALWEHLGWLLDARGLSEDALAAFERALALTRQSDATRFGRARAEWARAHALLRAGKDAPAQLALDELQAVWMGLYAQQRQPEVAEYLARTLVDLGELERRAGRDDRARARFIEARRRFVEAGAQEAAPDVLRDLDQRLAALPAR